MKKILLFLLIACPAFAQNESMPLNGTLINLAGGKTDLTNYYTISAPTLTAPLTLVLPSTAGTSGYFLKTDGAGNLSWASASSSGMTNPMTTTGDVIYSSDNSGTPARLGIGGIGSVLISEGVPYWSNNPFLGTHSTMTFGLASGDNNNYNLNNGNAADFILNATVSSATVTGIVTTAAFNVVRLAFQDGQGLSMTIANENTNSLAANRFVTLTGADETMHDDGVKLFTYEYDITDAGYRWVETASNPPELPSGAGTVTSISNSDGTLTLSPNPITTTGTVSLNLSTPNNWTAEQQSLIDGLGTTEASALGVLNATQATSGAPVQNSPSFRWEGTVWNATGATSDYSFATQTLIPISGATPSSYSLWEFSPTSGTPAEAARLTSDGVFSPVTGFQIDHAAPTAGHYLRSDGTNFVDGTIQASDLPTLSANNGVTGNGVGTPFTIDDYYGNYWHAEQQYYPNPYTSSAYMDMIALGHGGGVALTTPTDITFYSGGIYREAHAWQTGGTPGDVEFDEQDALVPVSATTVTTASLQYQFRTTTSGAWATKYDMFNSGDFAINGASVVAGAGLSIKNAHIQSQQTTAPTGTTESTGCGTAGTGGTAATESLTNATDIAGEVSVSTTNGALFPGGINPVPGNIVAVNYNISYTTAPIVVLTPADAATQSIGGYVSSSTTGSFIIGVAGLPPGSAIATYTWYYHVIETQ